MRHIGLLIMLLAIMLLPETAKCDNGAYGFLGIPSSARLYGLGGLNISTVEDNLNVADQNPALLGPEMGGWVDVNYMRYVGESNFAGMRYGKASSAHSAWMTRIQYFGYGKIDETMADGSVVGSFSPVDVVVSGSYGIDISSRWRCGATLKMLYSNYASSTAWAMGVDLGLNYYNPDGDLSISVVGANLGGQLKKFDTIDEKLPFNLMVGVTRGISSLPLRWSLTAYNLTRWRDGNGGIMKHIVAGIDFTPSDKFYMSLGYNYKVRSEMKGYHRSILSGFSAGAGLSASCFNVGVAIAQPHTGATTFMVNLGIKIIDLVK